MQRDKESNDGFVIQVLYQYHAHLFSKVQKQVNSVVIWLTVLESLGHRLFKEYSGFPLGLENLEKWEGIFQSGKSQWILNRLEKSGKKSGNFE